MVIFNTPLFDIQLNDRPSAVKNLTSYVNFRVQDWMGSSSESYFVRKLFQLEFTQQAILSISAILVMSCRHTNSQE